jgi:hypothetical protein
MPFQKQCSTYFKKRLEHLSAVGAFFSGWDIFEEGHKALPCTGYASPYIT